VVLGLSLGYSSSVLLLAPSGLSKVHISKFLHSCNIFMAYCATLNIMLRKYSM